jgi:hypothetical protein
MTPKTIELFLAPLSIEDLEAVIQIARKHAYWQAQDKVYAFDEPAYRYWASGFPDGPWALPENHPQRKKWDAQREKLYAVVEKYAPSRYTPPQLKPRTKLQRFFDWLRTPRKKK